MKVNFRIASFRTRIILTLILVITTLSFLSFFTYNHFLSRKIYRNSEDDYRSVLQVLRDQILEVHDGRMIKPFLKTIDENKHVVQSYLIDAKGRVTYPSHSGLPNLNQAQLDRLNEISDDISIKTNYLSNPPVSRAYLRMQNRPSCYACHNTTQPVLGYIMIDFSMHQSEDTMAFSRNFSIGFTLLMVLLILGFVALLHYKFVRQSLFRFKSTINRINSGDLGNRIEIPDTKELGELGKSFNEMVDNFQKTQLELQKYHQRELRNAEKMATIGEMSARLAHEIRNPITGIANAIEIINNENGNGKNKSILEEIQRQANRVNKAIANLLKFSRSHELNIQEGDLNEIIRSVVFFLENQSAHRNMSFGLELDPGLPHFDFDSEQIENVLINLGLNAVQACQHDCKVTYSTSYNPGDKTVRIAVSDNGPGIPEDTINEVFKPFFTTRTEGTGLGLAIAQEVIGMHNGEISVTNNADRGCTFYISLNV
jgi:two-component system, NtrC family, sensor kinase